MFDQFTFALILMTDAETPAVIEEFVADHEKNAPKGPLWVRKALAQRRERGADTEPHVCKAGRRNATSLAEKQNILKHKQVKDLNHGSTSRGGIFQHQYTTNGKLLCTVSPDNEVQFFKVHGAEGEKAGTVATEIPAYSIHYMLDETKLFCAGRSAEYAIVDIETMTSKTHRRGNFLCNDFTLSDAKLGTPIAAVGSSTSGDVTMFDTRTYRAVSNVRLSSGVECLSFDRSAATDSPLMWICAGGEVSLWDLRFLRGASGYNQVVNKHADHGGVHIHSFAVSQGLYAVGSDVGVVSVYDAGRMRNMKAEEGSADQFTPLHTLLNLKMRITSIGVSPDERRILYASDAEQNAVRMFDTVTQKTYKNFPPFHSHSYGRTLSAKFSPNGELATLGSSKGRLYTFHITAE